MRNRVIACGAPTMVSLAVLAIAACGQTTGQGKAEVLAPEPLAISRTMFLAPLGTSESSALIREKLRATFLHGGRWLVVDDSAGADVVLTGSATVVEEQTKGTTDYYGAAQVRLVTNRPPKTVWVFEYKRGYCAGGCSVSTRVSNQIATALQEIPTKAPY